MPSPIYGSASSARRSSTLQPDFNDVRASASARVRTKTPMEEFMIHALKTRSARSGRATEVFAPKRIAIACALAVSGTLLIAGGAEARITKLQITTTESPTFGGYTWPGVGQYEKIAGKAFGELNPNDPKNAVITDLKLAPKNASGKVEYSFDFYILKPIDLSKGNHKMLYEPPNRGRKTIAALNRGVGGNDPGSVTDPRLLADSFLMPPGYSISFSGWDASAET